MASDQVHVLFLRDTHHGGPGDQPQTVAARLAAFANAATETRHGPRLAY